MNSTKSNKRTTKSNKRTTKSNKAKDNKAKSHQPKAKLHLRSTASASLKAAKAKAQAVARNPKVREAVDLGAKGFVLGSLAAIGMLVVNVAAAKLGAA